jgi:2-C-methyl-D-erythritol 4-phosphate cytidylyltransferase
VNSGNRETLPVIWGIIPAAGIGQRMQTDIPKQYITINNKTVLQHSCERLLENMLVCGLVIAVREDDAHWPAVFEAIKSATGKPVLTVQGGKERADSVYNALQHLQTSQLANAASTWRWYTMPCAPVCAPRTSVS